MEDYLFLNRCAITVVPKAPFWEWVNKTVETDDSFFFEPKGDHNIYLIPDFESAENIDTAIEKYIAEKYSELFIKELEEWYMDPLAFPEISFEVFKEWFDVHTHTMIFDMVKKPLKRM
jgi:hypothetical protein